MNDRSGDSLTLPTERLNTKVRIRRVSRTNEGTMKNLLSGWVKDIISKGMTTMIQDTKNVANSFNRVKMEMTINLLVVALLPKMEA
jgi:hypothetical protein